MAETESAAHEVPTEPLAAVAAMAAALLRADADDDSAGVQTAAEAVRNAAMAAIAAGHSLRDVARAEEEGQETVRNELRADALRRVDRAGQRMRDAEDAWHAAISRAMRLGLSAREVAQAAGVKHGTIRAITGRRAIRGAAADVAGAHTDQDHAA